MPNPALRATLSYLRQLAGDGLSDRQLLERFASQRDESAFATLLHRHGPLVLATCRRILRQEQDAEDAFQATFLVLAEKAGSTRWGDTIAPWLYEVACRLACETRDREARRRWRERQAAPISHTALDEQALGALDAELHRLPERYRAPLVLRYLQGHTREEAARLLGWSLRTLDRRLSEGRQRLRLRLERLGVSPPAVLPMLQPESLAALLGPTVRAAGTFAQGGMGGLASAATTLASGYLKSRARGPLLAILLLALGLGPAATTISRPGAAGEAQAAPAPVRQGHVFRPVDPRWIVKINLLRPQDELASAYIVVELKDRDPKVTDYLTERTYYAKVGDTKARKVLRYYPSGQLATEIDNEGNEQHSRHYYPDGKVAYYLHWRAGKWLNGHSISPDGKVRHELKGGMGEIVMHGKLPGTTLHTWYHQAFPYLEVERRQGKVERGRLNDGSNWLIVTRDRESLLLLSRDESWDKARGGPARMQNLKDGINFAPRWDNRRRDEEAKLYVKRRGEFLAGYEKRLKAAGRDWKGLGIDMIRTGAAWPK